jgi:hypothetical protein
MNFNAPRPSFGQPKPAPGAGVPLPFLGKAARRRLAMLGAAGDVLAELPGPGESLHAIMTGAYDLMHVVVALIGQLGACETIRIATLSYNERNLLEMFGILEDKAAARLTLVCSAFFRDHNKELWQRTLDGFRQRGQRVAAARSHVKVVTFHTTAGRKLSLEGSANLRTNGNREQFALTDDAALHDWHTAHIDELVTAHEGEEKAGPQA